MASPTQRTMEHLREEGMICDVVERFNRFGGAFGVRVDLFGFIDVIAVDEELGIIGIQCCGTSFSEHEKKILANENAPLWLKARGKIELWGWRKLKVKRGGKAVRYTPRVRKFTLADFK